ncbi:hypothetical protein [Sorangium cellulosum]|uniref:hypothetical protein n=1 Tax=Sorangium cellulosum TaxID=56 RepID=UPI0005D1E44B|nr:hypothetical protein [Sorangium cellulosum]
MTPPATLDPDLQRALSDPGFTPGRRHFAALMDLLETADEPAELAERALRRAGAAALPAALERAAGAPLALRAPLTRLVGKLMAAGPIDPEVSERARDYLLACLGDDDRRTRRMAAVALGKPRAARSAAAPRSRRWPSSTATTSPACARAPSSWPGGPSRAASRPRSPAIARRSAPSGWRCGADAGSRRSSPRSSRRSTRALPAGRSSPSSGAIRAAARGSRRC